MIGDIIKLRRKQSGLTQSQLAQKAKVRQSTVSTIESGQNTDLDTLNKILRALNGELRIRWKETPVKKHS